MQQRKKPGSATPTSGATPGLTKKKVAAPQIDDVVNDIDSTLEQTQEKEHTPSPPSRCGCW